ncbi:MAG TPA: ABC transporter permease [Bacteroidetes bacterium]|nr:ABC transporter permease [Bacteroidota bacterium]
MFFKKKQKQIAEKIESGKMANSPFSLMNQRFRRNRMAVWSLRFLYLLFFVAIFADFIANEKPVYCKLDGKVYFPVMRQYLVDLGLDHWEARFFQNDWDEHAYEAVIFPPIPYSSKTIDGKNRGYTGPFDEQKISSLRYRHWLGTDNLGHDVAAGMVSGTRTAMLVGIISMSIASFIGILLGALAGFFGDDRFRMNPFSIPIYIGALLLGWFYAFMARGYVLSEAAREGGLAKELFISFLIFGFALLLAKLATLFIGKIPALNKKVKIPLDLIIMRTVEVLNSIPGFLLLLSIVGVLQQGSIFVVMAIIGLIRWTGIARFLRAELLRIRNLEYIESARAMGFSNLRILFRHALPNALTPVLIAISFGVASSILLESALSFLGFGIGEETVTWGNLLSAARKYPGAWWLALFPGGAIFVTVTVFNLIGEGLTNALRND